MKNCILLTKEGASIAALKIKKSVSSILDNVGEDDSIAIDIASKILSDFDIIAKTNSTSIISTQELLNIVRRNTENDNTEFSTNIQNGNSALTSITISGNNSFVIVKCNGMQKMYSTIDYHIAPSRINSYLGRAQDLYFQLRYEHGYNQLKALKTSIKYLLYDIDDKINLIRLSEKINSIDDNENINEINLNEELNSFYINNKKYNTLLDAINDNPDSIDYILESAITANLDNEFAENIFINKNNSLNKKSINLYSIKNNIIQKNNIIYLNQDSISNIINDRDVIKDAIDRNDITLMAKLMKNVNLSGIEKIKISSFRNERLNKKEKNEDYIRDQILDNEESLSSFIEFSELEDSATSEEKIQDNITDDENGTEKEDAEGVKYDSTRGEAKQKIDPFIASRLATIAKKTFSIIDGKIVSFDAINPETGFKIYEDTNNIIRVLLETFASISYYSNISSKDTNTDVYDKLKLKINELAKINPTYNSVYNILKEYGSNEFYKNKFISSLYLTNINYVNIQKSIDTEHDSENHSNNSTIDLVETNKYNSTIKNFRNRIVNIYKSKCRTEQGGVLDIKNKIGKVFESINGNIEDTIKIANIINDILGTEITPFQIYNTLNNTKNPITLKDNAIVKNKMQNIILDLYNSFISVKETELSQQSFGQSDFTNIIKDYLKISKEQSDNMLIGPNGKVYSKANPSYTDRFLDQLINNMSKAQKKYLGISMTDSKSESSQFSWVNFYKSLANKSVQEKIDIFNKVKMITILQDKVSIDDGAIEYKTRKTRSVGEFKTNQMAATLNFVKDGNINYATFPNAADKLVSTLSVNEPNTLSTNGDITAIFNIISNYLDGKITDITKTVLFSKILCYAKAEAFRYYESFYKLNDENETTNNSMGKATKKQYPYIYNDNIIYLTKKDGSALKLKLADINKNPIRLKGFVKVIGEKDGNIISTNTLKEAEQLDLTNIHFIGNAFSSFFYKSNMLEDNKLFKKNEKYGYYEPIDESIFKFTLNFESSSIVKDSLVKQLNNEIRQHRENLTEKKGVVFDSRILKGINNLLINKKKIDELKDIYIQASSLKYKFDQIERSYLYGGGVEYYKNKFKDKDILNKRQDQISDVSADFFKRIYALESSGVHQYFASNEDNKIKCVIINDIIYKSEMGEDTDSTDGGGYVHYMEAVKFREKIGNLSLKEKNIIDRLRNGEEISDSEMAFLFQPIKPFFFNLEESGPLLIKNAWTIITPWLGKNSKIPILTNIYNLMEENNISLVLPQSNVKVGVHNAIDIMDDSKDVGYEIIDFSDPKNTAYKEQLVDASFDIDGNYLIQHTATPEHAIHKMDMPRGVLENIISILDRESEINIYDLTNGIVKTIKTHLFKYGLVQAISNLRDSQVKDILDNVGIKINKNWEIIGVENFTEKQIEFAKKYIIDENTPQDIVNAIENGTPLNQIIPLQNIIKNKLASNIRKEINTIKMLGGQLIQAPQFGFLVPNNLVRIFGDLVMQSKSGQYYFDSNIDSKEYESRGVKFFRNSTNGIQRMNYDISDSQNGKTVIPFECLVTTNYVREQIPELKDSDDSAIMDLLENNPETRRILSSRIPAQSVASSSVMEIVGILPQSMGDTIVSYLDMTRINGSDFDVDKMYCIFPYLKFENNKISLIKPSNNKNASKKELSNYILSKIIEIGMDNNFREKYFKKTVDTHNHENILFNGFDKVPSSLHKESSKDNTFLPDDINMSAEDIYKLPIYSTKDSPFDMFSIEHQAEVEESAMNGKNLLGIIVVLRKSIMSMIKEYVAIKMNVPFANKMIEDGHETKFTKFGNEYTPEILGDKFELSDMFSEALNLAADNMKLPIFSKININNNTMFLYTAALSHSINLNLMCSLLTQQVTKLYSDTMSEMDSNNKYYTPTDEMIFNNVILKLLEQCNNIDIKKLDNKKILKYKKLILDNKTYLPLKAVSIQYNKYVHMKENGETSSKEYENLDKYFTSEEYAYMQIGALEILKDLANVGKVDSDFVLKTKTNITNKTPEDLIASYYRYNQLISEGGSYLENLIYKPQNYFFNEDGSPKFETIFSLYAQRDIMSLFQTFYNEFSYDNLSSIDSAFSLLLGRTINSGNDLNAIINTLKFKLMYDKFGIKDKTILAKYLSPNIDNSIFEKHDIVLSIFNKYGINNKLLFNLTTVGYGDKYVYNPSINRYEKLPPIVFRFELLANETDRSNKDEYINNFRQLILFHNAKMSEDEISIVRDFGKRLAIQTLISSNGKFSATSLKEYIPAEFYEIIGFNKLFKNSLNPDKFKDEINFVLEEAIRNGDIKIPYLNKNDILTDNGNNAIDYLKVNDKILSTSIITIDGSVMKSNNISSFISDKHGNQKLDSVYNTSKYIKCRIDNKNGLYQYIGQTSVNVDNKIKIKYIYIKTNSLGFNDKAFNFREISNDNTSLFNNNNTKYTIYNTDISTAGDISEYELKKLLFDNIYINSNTKNININYSNIYDIIDVLNELRTGKLKNESNEVENFNKECK